MTSQPLPAMAGPLPFKVRLKAGDREAGGCLTHATNIFRGGYEFESERPAISYELHKACASGLKSGQNNHQAAQRHVSCNFVPMVKMAIGQSFALDGCQHGAQDG